jgi:hypothetical protein
VKRILLSQDDIDEEKIRRAEEKKMKEERYLAVTEGFTNYNLNLQQDTNSRIEEIINAAHMTNASILPLWREREAYRIDVEAKNLALATLLEKGKEALRTELEREAGLHHDGKKSSNKNPTRKAK